MAESPGTAHSFRQFLNLDEVDLRDDLEYHLRNALSPPEGKGLVPVVDQQHFYLSPVVGINCTRTIEAGNAMLER